jgi:uncharacterized repeat protein (TIGR01451 family)
MRGLRLAVVFALVFASGVARADDLSVTKTATVVSDSLNALNPRSLPGAVVDYKIIFTNPVGNLFKPVRNIVVSDMLPANVVMRVADLSGAGAGPVEFNDGSLLGLGLLGSGLTYTFTSLGSGSDQLEFYDGSSWTYTPIPDANGYDAAVRGIRVKPTTTFATSGSFQIRFRVKIR